MHLFTCARGDQGVDAHVDTHHAPGFWQRYRVRHFTHQTDVPASRFSDNTTGLYLTLIRSMPADMDPSHARHFQATIIDFEAVTKLLEAYAMPAFVALEARVSGFFTCFYSPKEGLKCTL
jgi:hypothetical protein